MNVTLKMTRAENVARYGAGPVSLDIEEYLCGVVPAEIYESAHMEALKAQAVAARTFAAKRALAGTVMNDTTSFQAYRCSLAEKSPRSRQAVMDTAG
jgi:SpoIID/LytB domain protein